MLSSIWNGWLDREERYSKQLFFKAADGGAKHVPMQTAAYFKDMLLLINRLSVVN